MVETDEQLELRWVAALAASPSKAAGGGVPSITRAEAYPKVCGPLLLLLLLLLLAPQPACLPAGEQGPRPSLPGLPCHEALA